MQSFEKRCALTDLIKSRENKCTQTIFCFTETWLDQTILDSVLDESKSYNIVRLDRQTNKKGGELLVMIPKSIPYNVLNQLSVSANFIECLSINFYVDKVKHNLGLVYRPPVYYSCENELQLYISAISKLCLQDVDCIIVGDFNHPNINWKQNIGSNRQEKLLLESINNLGFHQINDSPTRNQNILDICLTNNPIIVEKCFVGDNFGSETTKSSDHSSLCIKTSIKYKTNNKDKIINNFKRANWFLIEQNLSQLNWDSLFEYCSGVEDRWNIFKNICNSLIETFVPKYRCGKNKFEPVTNGRLKFLKKYEANLRRKIRSSRNPTQRQIQNRKRIARLIKTIRTGLVIKQENHLIATKDSRKFWNFIKQKQNNVVEVPTLISKQNENYISDFEKSEALNKQFAASFTVPDSASNNVTDSEKANRTELNRITFTEIKVLNYLTKLNTKSSCSLDNIPNIFLKKLGIHLAYPLKSIFEVSFQLGQIPLDWKTAKIIPLSKKPSPTSSLDDYRPISITSSCCKLMESIINAELKHFCENNHVFTDFQFGFRQNKSTDLNLLTCLNDWTKNFEENSATDVFYADFRKAFDTVSHQKLLAKLDSVGIKGKLLDWITQYLKDRLQFVNINQAFSSTIPVTSGVPQGSVISPTLFCLFINDIVKVIKQSNVALFADDLKLHKKITHAADSIQLQEDINAVIEWSKENGLQLHPDKCVILHLNSKKNPKFNYMIGTKQLNVVQSHRDLGVIIDNDLTFDTYISKLTSSCNQKVGALRRTYNSNNKDFFKKLFNCFIQSCLDFSTTAWSPRTVEQKRNIERIQRRFSKWVLNSDQTYKQRLESLNLKSQLERRLENDLVMLFKLVKNPNLSTKLYDELTFIQNRTRGHSKRIAQQHAQSSQRNSFWLNRTTAIWNSLSEETVNSENTQVFKKRLHKNDQEEINRYLTTFENVIS